MKANHFRIFFFTNLLVCIGANVYGQSITHYGDFILESNQITWVHIYDRSGVDSLALLETVSSSVASDNAFELVSREGNKVIYKVVDKIFEPKSSLFSGRLVLEFKVGRYRASFGSITYKLNSSQKAAYEAFSGLKMDPGQIAVEKYWVTKDGSSIKKGSLKALDAQALLFRKTFDFNQKAKEDW